MDSLLQKLACCPCGGEWIEQQNSGWKNDQVYDCAKCNQMIYIEDKDEFYLIRKMIGKRIWWCSNFNCVIETIDNPYEIYVDRDARILDFVLPFQLDEERLKTLLLMS